MFLVDRDGALLFYNEAAGQLLGHPYQEAAEMPMGEWSTVFRPTDEEGRPIAPEQLPLSIALRERRPSYRQLCIVGLDDVVRKIGVAAIPLEGQQQRDLGALAIFSEVMY
jgi:hypothetical protein